MSHVFGKHNPNNRQGSFPKTNATVNMGSTKGQVEAPVNVEAPPSVNVSYGSAPKVLGSFLFFIKTESFSHIFLVWYKNYYL